MQNMLFTLCNWVIKHFHSCFRIQNCSLLSLQCEMSLSGCSKLTKKFPLYHVLNHVPAPAWYVNELIDLSGFSPFFSLIFNEDIELRGSSRQEIALYFHNGKEAKYRHNAWIQQFQANAAELHTSSSGKNTSHCHFNRKPSSKPSVGYPLIHFSHLAIEAIPDKKRFSC